MRILYVVSCLSQWSIPSRTVVPSPICQKSLSLIKFADVARDIQKFELLLKVLDGFLIQPSNDGGAMYFSYNTSYQNPYIAISFQVPLAARSSVNGSRYFIPQPQSYFGLERDSHDTSGSILSSIFHFHRYLNFIFLK